MHRHVAKLPTKVAASDPLIHQSPSTSFFGYFEALSSSLFPFSRCRGTVWSCFLSFFEVFWGIPFVKCGIKPIHLIFWAALYRRPRHLIFQWTENPKLKMNPETNSELPGLLDPIYQRKQALFYILKLFLVHKKSRNSLRLFCPFLRLFEDVLGRFRTFLQGLCQISITCSTCSSRISMLAVDLDHNSACIYKRDNF